MGPKLAVDRKFDLNTGWARRKNLGVNKQKQIFTIYIFLYKYVSIYKYV